MTQNLSVPGAHNITRDVLPNGITVLIYENFAAQSVVFTGSLRAGSLYETPEKNGLAAMTASALMRGTTKRDFFTIAAALEDIGADINIGAGGHRVSFSGKSLAEDFGTLIDVLADVLRNPNFPAQQVERMRGEIIAGLKYRTQDTRYRANRAFHEALYPANHPYHYSTRGTLETVPNIAVADLAAFHQQHYGPDGMIIAVSGAVKANDVLNTIRAHFADWANPAQPAEPALPELTPPANTVISTVNLPGKTQADIVLGVLGPARAEPDYIAAVLANSVIGEFGMMGRIGESVREKLGLAYYAYSQLEGGFGPGAWSVSAGVNPANVELAIDRINDELRRISSEPISDSDLADNQAYYVGRLPLSLESNEGIAGRLLMMETHQLGLDYLVNYRDMIYGVTKDDLLAAARRYIRPDALVIGIATPIA